LDLLSQNFVPLISNLRLYGASSDHLTKIKLLENVKDFKENSSVSSLFEASEISDPQQKMVL
jgi:hypothetical protein